MAGVGVVLHGTGGVSFPFAGVVVVFGSLSEVVEDVVGEVGVDGVGVVERVSETGVGVVGPGLLENVTGGVVGSEAGEFVGDRTKLRPAVHVHWFAARGVRERQCRSWWNPAWKGGDLAG